MNSDTTFLSWNFSYQKPLVAAVVEPREVEGVVVGVDDVPDGEPGGQDVLSRKAGLEHNTKNTTPKDQLLYQLILKL